MLLSEVPGNGYRVWDLQGEEVRAISLPASLVILTPRVRADLDHDGVVENILLESETAQIWKNSVKLWQSPPAWKIEQAELGDLNRDGWIEAVLLVWRPYRPWPIDSYLPNSGRTATFHDRNGQSCHIILITCREAGCREAWAGSALADPVAHFALSDLNGDGIEELATLEKQYDDPKSSPANILGVWEWNGFGFTRLSKVEGVFMAITTIRSESGGYLLLSQP